MANGTVEYEPHTGRDIETAVTGFGHQSLFALQHSVAIKSASNKLGTEKPDNMSSIGCC